MTDFENRFLAILDWNKNHYLTTEQRFLNSDNVKEHSYFLGFPSICSSELTIGASITPIKMATINMEMKQMTPVMMKGTFEYFLLPRYFASNLTFQKVKNKGKMLNTKSIDSICHHCFSPQITQFTC